MGWFDFWGKPEPEPEPKTKIIEFGRTRFDDIEDDIKDIKDGLKKFIEQTQEALNGLRKRIADLEEEQEWKPRLGDRVRFRHDFFGEMEGIFTEAVYPTKWSLLFRDPSNGGNLKYYTADAKDVRKA